VGLPANASGRLIAHNTPRYAYTAKNLGTEEASKIIEVSITLITAVNSTHWQSSSTTAPLPTIVTF